MGGTAGQGECQVSSCVRGYHVDVRASLITQLVKNLQYRRPWVDSRVGKIPRRKDRLSTTVFLSFPGGSDSQESTCNMGDLGVIPDWEDPLEEGMVTHSSILARRIPVDRGAWWATYSPWGRKEVDTTERLSPAHAGVNLGDCEAQG